jgi:Tfp pilus assembly protein PilP
VGVLMKKYEIINLYTNSPDEYSVGDKEYLGKRKGEVVEIVENYDKYNDADVSMFSHIVKFKVQKIDE